MQMDEGLKTPLVDPGMFTCYPPPMISEFRANFSARNFHAVYRTCRGTEKHFFYLRLLYDDRYSWCFQPPEELSGIVIIRIII